MKYAIIIGILALFIVAGCTAGNTACTMEGKVCSDGTTVGRSGDNCEFDPCPSVLTQGTFIQEELFVPENDITSTTFTDKAELEEFIKSHESSNNGGFYGGGRGIMMESMTMDSAPIMNKVAADQSSVDFSQTNNQVSNVDEADIIKTDGNFIYTLDGNNLYIISAGEEAEVVSTIEFERRPSNIFIKGDRLAIFGNFYDNEFFKEIDYTPRSGMSFLNIYDVSDRTNPKLEKEYKFEGNYFQGRMINNYMYIVTTTSPYYQSPMPILYDGLVREEISIDRIHYYNIPYDNPQFANIHALNMDEPEELSSKSVVIEGSRNLYMSENNMYLTYTEYINEWEIQQKITRELIEPLLPTGDRLIIEKIKNTDNEVLSQSEKEQKIYQLVQNYIMYLTQDEQEKLNEQSQDLVQIELDKFGYMEYSIIHKITVDKNNIDIGETGKVPGHVVNQFSMDEYENVFRIATTTNARWSRYEEERTQSSNHVFTLDEDLSILDHLEGLAQGERIYSTRFMGDKLFMVTFKQVDPFFVIDLSNPSNIKELGELKIPGFSRYLHPYDENTIIGIGQDATTNGRTSGLKISLFDVSDVSNPKEIAKFVAEGKHSNSAAEYEHKAFLFSKEKNLLVIPAYSYDWENDEGYNGAMVFNITKEDIELKGIIDHGTDNRYNAQVQRSLYIKDLLYTKSNNLLRVNELNSLQGVIDVELETDGPYKVY